METQSGFFLEQQSFVSIGVWRKGSCSVMKNRQLQGNANCNREIVVSVTTRLRTYLFQFVLFIAMLGFSNQFDLNIPRHVDRRRIGRFHGRFNKLRYVPDIFRARNRLTVTFDARSLGSLRSKVTVMSLSFDSRD